MRLDVSCQGMTVVADTLPRFKARNIGEDKQQKLGRSLQDSQLTKPWIEVSPRGSTLK